MNDQHFERRRELLKAALAAPAAWIARSALGEEPAFHVHAWQRDARNPVLPPGGGAFDVGCCMNPFVVRRADEYWLYYAGADAKGHRRICLATAKIDDLTHWKRVGPLFDVGGKGAFDETWCVLPCVQRVGDRWHLYYTGRSAQS